MIIYAYQYETIDALAYRIFGYTRGIVEQIVTLNPGLCELAVRLPAGTAVKVPDKAPTANKPSIKLWD